MEATYATKVRKARPEDVGAIRRIARSSFETSYGDVLSRDTIAEAVTRWYGNDAFQVRRSDPEKRFLVAQTGTELTGFSESTIEADGDVGVIDWLHVDPYHRERGIGSKLLEETEQTLVSAGVMRVEGRVIAENEIGNAFYRSHEYRQTGSRTIDIEGTVVEENRYLGFPDRETVDGLFKPIERESGTFYVALDERERGSKAPFYRLYQDEDRKTVHGYCCANCESIAVTMSTMGQLECNSCGNTRKPTRWDAAYL